MSANAVDSSRKNMQHRRRSIVGWGMVLAMYGLAGYAALGGEQEPRPAQPRRPYVHAGLWQPPREADEKPAQPKQGQNASDTTEAEFSIFNQTWAATLQQLADETGSTLVMRDSPPGRFTRRDKEKHSRTELVRILNRELEREGFRLLEQGEFLVLLNVEELRSRYERPELPRHPQRRATVSRAPSRPEAPKYRREVHTIASRNGGVVNAAASGESAPRRPIVPTAGTADRTAQPPRQQLPAAPPTARDAAVSPRSANADMRHTRTAVSLQHGTATQVAKEIYLPLKQQSRLVSRGPGGLPAFAVFAKAVQTAGTADTPPRRPSSAQPPALNTPRFSIGIDSRQNRLIVEAPAAHQQQIQQLVRWIDEAAGDDGRSVHLTAATPRTWEIARRFEKTIPLLVDQRGGKGPLRLTQAPESGNPADSAPVPNPQTTERQPGAPMPPTGNAPPAAAPRTGVDLPAIVGGLKGDVSVESLRDLGVLILRGNEKDVESVMAVIRQLEQLSQGVTPDIHLLNLRHVNSEALAVLLNDVYTRLTTLQNRGVEEPPRTVIVPVVTPNALLILAPEVDMESILRLAEELDQPVDPSSEVEVFRLRHAVASQVVTLIRDFYQERAGLGTRVLATADARTNSVIVQARPRDLSEVERLIRKIDRGDSASVSRMRVFPLKNAIADELQEVVSNALQSMLSTGGATGQFAGAGGGGQASQQLTEPRSIALEFLATDGRTQQLIRSGILSDIRVTADTRINSLVVTAPEQSMKLMEALIQQLDQPTSTVAEIKVFSLANGDAAGMVELLRALFESPDQQNALGVQIAGAEDASSGLIPLRFSVDVRTNSIIAVGGAEALRVVEAILLRLDESDIRQRRTIVVRLKNSPVTEVANAINLFLQSQRDLVTLDPELISNVELLEREIVVVPEPVSNSLLVSATPRYFEEIERIIFELDQAPAQVIIQALLVEVELSQTDEFGVEIGVQDSVLFDRSLVNTENFLTVTDTVTNGQIQTSTQRIINQEGVPGFNFNNPSLPLGNNTNVRPSSVGTQGLSNFALGRVNSDLGYGGLVLSAGSESLNALIRALAARRNVHILSRPQIRTVDNQLAQIQVGQIVPRVQGVTVTDNFANPVVQDTNVGIILTVTPRISPDGSIVMETVAEKSRLSGQGVPIFTDISTGAVTESPIIDITTARTTVAVPNGQTIVLGGMITRSDDTLERKVPWFGDIPLLGTAFRYDSTTTRRTELLIFLTPRIIRDDADSEMIKQIEAERLHFIEKEAEELHGPLFGVAPPSVTPPPLMFEQFGPPVLPPEETPVVPPAPGPALPQPVPPVEDDVDVPTTRMSGNPFDSVATAPNFVRQITPGQPASTAVSAAGTWKPTQRAGAPGTDNPRAMAAEAEAGEGRKFFPNIFRKKTQPAAAVEPGVVRLPNTTATSAKD